jgi:hypothetical protein
VKNIIERNEPYYFVETMSQLWGNYQRFIFAHDFVIEKLKGFYETLYKMPVAKDYSKDGSAEVTLIPVIAVNELKKCF